VFVHMGAVERAGMRDLNEGHKISYDVVADRRTGKSSADNLSRRDGGESTKTPDDDVVIA
jgi:cold shock CspA family protein